MIDLLPEFTAFMEGADASLVEKTGPTKAATPAIALNMPAIQEIRSFSIVH